MIKLVYRASSSTVEQFPLKELVGGSNPSWLTEMIPKFKIPNIQKTVISEEAVKSRNIENFVGSVQVPLGIAGPIKIKDLKRKVKNYYLPLATSEGALVASVNRGCKATKISGGISTFAEDVGATRGPLFTVKNLSEGKRLIHFVEKNFNKIQKLAQEGEPYIKLLTFG